MLEVQWEYLEKNICVADDMPVAIMRPKNNPNQWILRVYEARSYHCCAVAPEYSFFKPNQVPYSLESEKVKEHYDSASLAKLSPIDRLALPLKEGCKIIEEDCKEQADRILNLIS